MPKVTQLERSAIYGLSTFVKTVSLLSLIFEMGVISLNYMHISQPLCEILAQITFRLQVNSSGRQVGWGPVLLANPQLLPGQARCQGDDAHPPFEAQALASASWKACSPASSGRCSIWGTHPPVSTRASPSTPISKPTLRFSIEAVSSLKSLSHSRLTNPPTELLM